MFHNWKSNLYTCIYHFRKRKQCIQSPPFLSPLNNHSVFVQCCSRCYSDMFLMALVLVHHQGELQVTSHDARICICWFEVCPVNPRYPQSMALFAEFLHFFSLVKYFSWKPVKAYFLVAIYSLTTAIYGTEIHHRFTESPRNCTTTLVLQDSGVGTTGARGAGAPVKKT